MLWVTPDARKPQSAPPKQQLPFSLGPGKGVYASSGSEYPRSPSGQRKGLELDMSERPRTSESNEPGYKPQSWGSVFSSPKLGELFKPNDGPHIKRVAHSKRLRKVILLPLPQSHLPQTAQGCLPSHSSIIHSRALLCLLQAASLLICRFFALQ